MWDKIDGDNEDKSVFDKKKYKDVVF